MNRRLPWGLAVIAACWCAPAATVVAADADAVPDERESPALRKPLPVLTVPSAETLGDPTEFNPEAPPPPPLDPSYRAPVSSSTSEGTSP